MIRLLFHLLDNKDHNYSFLWMKSMSIYLLNIGRTYLDDYSFSSMMVWVHWMMEMMNQKSHISIRSLFLIARKRFFDSGLACLVRFHLLDRINEITVDVNNEYTSVYELILLFVSYANDDTLLSCFLFSSISKFNYHTIDFSLIKWNIPLVERLNWKRVKA